MNKYDLIEQFDRDYGSLSQQRQAASDRYQNARSALGNVLNFVAMDDHRPEFQSAHSEIGQVKLALAELRRIEEQMVARLDQLDGDMRR